MFANLSHPCEDPLDSRWRYSCVVAFCDNPCVFLALNRDDEELTGSEDPSVLYSVVANLPAQQAYKEGKHRGGRTQKGLKLWGRG